MTNDELYIGGELIDLTPEVVIAYTYQVNNIAELQDRQANYSNEFDIPMTADNVRKLGFPNLVTTNSNAPYRRLSCSHYKNGVGIIENGVAIIKGSSSSIKVVVYSGIYDFFQQIADRSINEIDFSELDHYFTINDIKTLNEEDGAIIWPVVQYGGVTIGSNTIDVRYQCPQIKLPYVIDKIFAQTDYSKFGNIFSLPEYRDMSITLTPDELIDSEASRLSKSGKLHTDKGFDPAFAGEANYKFQFNSNDRFGGPKQPWMKPSPQNYYPYVFNLLSLFKDGTSGDSFIGTANPFRFGLESGNYPSSLDSRYYPNVEYVAPSQSILNINFRVFMKMNGTTPNDRIGVHVVINDTTEIQLQGYSFNQVDIIDNQYMELSVPGIRLKTGDSVKIYMDSAIDNVYGHSQIPGQESIYSYVQFEVVETSLIGDRIYVNSLIPDIKMIDIVRDFANLFGVIFSPSKNKKEILCTQFKEIAKNIELSEDWTDKLHDSKPPNIQYRIGSYARQNWMLWSNDSNTEGYGDYAFAIDDSTLERSYNVFQLVFSSSIPVSNLLSWPGITTPPGGNTGITIPRYTLIDAEQYSPIIEYVFDDLVLFNGRIWRALDDVNNVTPGTDPTKWKLNERQFEQTESSNARLVYNRRVQGTWIYSDGETVLESNMFLISYFEDPTQAYSLGFKSLQQHHYVDLIRMLSKLKAISIPMLLTKNDIRNLDFLKPKYIEKYQNYFYLNKVNEYIDDQPCIVDLIRL